MKVSSILGLILPLLAVVTASTTSQHTNNWAVLVSTSRFWFNYRHMANVLSFYRTFKRLGVPDSQIILMLSDDVACNSRNLFPGSVFNNKDRVLDLYGDSVEVDYKGYEVTVENFIRLLTDRWTEEQPPSKRLMTDENSNIFIYLTGHGGDDFLKFQDAEEIASEDIADAFEQMHQKKRYNEIFFMIDTCQANTMYSKFYSPNILAVGSSRLGESSYSHHSDVEIGVAVIDRFTYTSLEFLEQVEKNSTSTLQDLFDSFTFEKVHSHTGIRSDLFQRDPSDVLVTDFFASVPNIISDDDNENVEQDQKFMEKISKIATKTKSAIQSADEHDSTNDIEKRQSPQISNNKKIKHDILQSSGRSVIVSNIGIILFLISIAACIMLTTFKSKEVSDFNTAPLNEDVKSKIFSTL